MGRRALKKTVWLGLSALALALGCSGSPGADKSPAGPASESPGATRAAPAEGEDSKAAPRVAMTPPARPQVQLGTFRVLRAKELEVYGGLIGNEIGVIGGRIGGGGTAIATLTGRPRVVPTVVLGTPTIRGALDRAVVHRVMRRRIYSFRSCYQQQLRLKPQLSGTVWVRLTVGASGRIALVKASGMDKNVARCVQRAMRYVRFPRPKSAGQVQITYPFLFRTSAGGFSPIAQTLPPPVPKSLVSPSKPSLIPVTESPVLNRDVTEPEAESKSCYVAARPVGIEALVPAARVCYEQLLDRKPAWIGRVELLVDIDRAGAAAAARASGAHPDASFWKCLAASGKSLVLSGPAADQLRGDTLVLQLSFNKQGGAPLPTTRVTVSEHDLRIGLRLVASEVAWSRLSELTRIAWKTVLQEARAAGGQTVLRVDDGVDAGVVAGALAAYGNLARSLRFARKLDGGRWKIVNPLGGVPARGACKASAKLGRVSIRLDREAIWIGTDKGHLKIEKIDGKHDVLGYARALRSLRRQELAERSDLELGVAMPGVSYGLFVRVLEIAIESGFHDASVRPLRSMRNPRSLPPR